MKKVIVLAILIVGIVSSCSNNKSSHQKMPIVFEEGRDTTVTVVNTPCVVIPKTITTCEGKKFTRMVNVPGKSDTSKYLFHLQGKQYTKSVYPIDQENREDSHNWFWPWLFPFFTWLAVALLFLVGILLFLFLLALLVKLFKKFLNWINEPSTNTQKFKEIDSVVHLENQATPQVIPTVLAPGESGKLKKRVITTTTTTTTTEDYK